MTSEPRSHHQGAQPAVATAVGEVLVRYATAIDRRDWDLFRTCFADDCDIDYGVMPTGEALRWNNVSDMTAWMQESHREMGHTLHRITNQRVEGEGDNVTACSYIDVLLTTPDGHLIANGAGFYNDRLVHTEDGWKIAWRRFTSVRMWLGQTATAPLS